MKLERLIVEIIADTRNFDEGVDRAERRMDRLNERAEEGSRSNEKLGRSYDRLGTVVKQLGELNKKLDQTYSRLNKSMEDNRSQASRTPTDYEKMRNRLVKVFDDVETKMDRSGKGLSRYRKQLARLRAEGNRVITVGGNMGEVVDNLRKVLGKAGGLFDGVSKKTRGLSDEVRIMRRRLILLVAAILALLPHVSVLGSGLSASVVAIAGSLANALASAVPLAAVFAGFGVSFALAKSGMDTMMESFPGIGKAIDGLKGKWQEQADSFAENWGASVETFLTTLQDQLGSYDFGTPMGKAMSEVTEAFESMLQGEAFAAFMRAMTSEIPDAVSGFGQGFASLGEGLLSMIAASAPAAKYLGELFAGWAGELANTLEAARESGELEEFFDRAAESLRIVLKFVGSVTGALGTLFSAGQEHGDQMLQNLTDMFNTFDEWMQSVEGQKALDEWFTSAFEIMEGFQPLLVGIGGLFDNMVTPETIVQFSDLSERLGEILPLIGELLEVVAQAGVLNLLTGALQLIGDLLAPLMDPLRDLAQAIFPPLMSVVDQLGPVFQLLGEVLAPVIDALGNILGPILEWISTDVLPPIIDAVGRFLEALQPVVDFVTGALQAAFETVFPVIAAVVGMVVDNVVGFIDGLTKVIKGIVDFVTAIFQGDWNKAWNALLDIVTGAVQAVWNFINLMIVGKIVGAIKGAMASIGKFFKSGWDDIVGWVRGAIKNVQTVIDDVMKAISKTIDNIIKGIGNFFRNGFNAVKNTVTTVFNAIKKAIETPINAARDLIKKAIDKIKSFFQFKIKWPKIKLPHFSISGSINPLDWPSKGLPKIGVEWYAKGGILNSPTVFGMNGPNLMVGGEAGPEAIAPIDTLQSYVMDAVLSANGEMSKEIRQLRELMAHMLPALAEKNIVLDSGELVGAISTKIDSGMGNLGVRKERGWR